MRPHHRHIARVVDHAFFLFVGCFVLFIDDNTISGTADALAPVVPVRAIQGGRYVVALQEAN